MHEPWKEKSKLITTCYIPDLKTFPRRWREVPPDPSHAQCALCTLASFHQTISPPKHLTISPSHLILSQPCTPASLTTWSMRRNLFIKMIGIIFSSDPLTLSISHHLIISPSCNTTISQSHHLNIPPSHQFTISPSHLVHKAPTDTKASCFLNNLKYASASLSTSSSSFKPPLMHHHLHPHQHHRLNHLSNNDLTNSTRSVVPLSHA